MIKIKNLDYKYEDGTKALENININTNKGNIIGIIGANGSGKSTLFLNIMGILKPRKGFIEYNGKAIEYKKNKLIEYRKKVNIVFQDPDQQLFYPNIYDDIAFSLRNLGVSEEKIKLRVTDALNQVECLDLIDKPVHFLSYGQKKRVAIAGALVMDSKVLLMDEPTSGLDPYMRKEIKNIILEISQRKNVVISSHDMDLIYDICDYIYILNKGRITCQGKPEEVFLDSLILEEASLSKPWLVRIHEKMNGPLFKNEDEFNKFNGE
ncbi:MAG TPA: ATP-binding cassette domain-containing protein [Tissierellaceae bacterium]|nr:ATP-binding cassette domain-containing protein [Tissierellaceae bacterium]